MKNEGKKSIVQFIKFALVGVSNTGVDWIVYYILIRTLLSDAGEKPFAKAISFVVAVINSYIWNSIWTFKSEYQKSSKAGVSKTTIFVRFFVVGLIGWGVNYFVFRFSISSISNRDIIGLILASAAAVLWNFFANKFWTYRK